MCGFVGYIENEYIPGVKQLLVNYYRRLQHLRLKESKLGIDTPPQVLIEIDEIQQKIEHCYQELTHLKARNNCVESQLRDVQENRRVQVIVYGDESQIPWLSIKRALAKTAGVLPDQIEIVAAKTFEI
jgi:sRNA-binding carbon storage regulator CsrA